MITSKALAEALSAELETADWWGLIDPYWIKRIAETDKADPDEDQHETIEELRRVFARVAERLNAR